MQPPERRADGAGTARAALQDVVGAHRQPLERRVQHVVIAFDHLEAAGELRFGLPEQWEVVVVLDAVVLLQLPEEEPEMAVQPGTEARSLVIAVGSILDPVPDGPVEAAKQGVTLEPEAGDLAEVPVPLPGRPRVPPEEEPLALVEPARMPAQPTCSARKPRVRSRARRALSAWYEARWSQLKPWPAG